MYNMNHMSIDGIKTILDNGIEVLRDTKTTPEMQAKTLEVMAGILKQEAKKIRENDFSSFDLSK